MLGKTSNGVISARGTTLSSPMMMMTMMMAVMITMAWRHIPTMTNSHHGGFLSVMKMVGMMMTTMMMLMTMTMKMKMIKAFYLSPFQERASVPFFSNDGKIPNLDDDGGDDDDSDSDDVDVVDDGKL